MITKPPGLPPLPLSQTENGSLATAPLSTVINSATNELYQDFYSLVHSEIPIVSSVHTDASSSAAASGAKSPGKEEPPHASNELSSRKLRMSALSFAQRRHELTRRLILHTKSLSHVYSLVSSSLPTKNAPNRKSRPLGEIIQTSSAALQYVRSAWQSADETQDALYFHHDGLWRSRAHAHDVLGALCVLGGGYWPDFPSDVALMVDRYENSKERGYGVQELGERLRSCVGRKLVLGEVGEFGVANSVGSDNRNSGDGLDGGLRKDMPLPWRVVIEPGGGAIRLTFGAPRIMSTAEALRQQSLAESQPDDNDNNDGNGNTENLQQYPMEARLSVLSEAPNAPWKLLSLQVQCSPKTGESDHQLRMNKKQMFDLHRIGERVMIVEEAICRKAEQKETASMEGDGGNEAAVEMEQKKPVPRPLLRLFEVTHSFALSMQLEMLSSQAEALRRGAWGGFVGIPSVGTTNKDTLGDGIAVSPAHFFDEAKRVDSTMAVMAVHFWSCDDRYGSPKVGDLFSTNDVNSTAALERGDKLETASSTASLSYSKLDRRADDNYLPTSDNRGEKRLSLCIRAVPMVGLVVSLSGGSDVASALTDQSASQQDHHLKRNIHKLLSSIQDPFQLSMSDALLAATVLCAQRRCRSVVDALNRRKTNKLPSWVYLEVECGSISVAARISYSATDDDNSQPARPHVILFRLACDSRTGRYIPVFPRPASLLRLLACHDASASDTQALRSAAANAMHARSGAAGKQNDGSAREATGRIVRDAFDALSRSMDTLGKKCGVGGDWNDIDKQSASLREKSVDQSCRDVVVSLMTCCGMAAVFGVAAIALKVATGVDPSADVAGGPIKEDTNPGLLNVPPLSVMLNQRMIEKVVKEGDGETKRISQLEGEVFAVTSKLNEDRLELVCFDVLTLLESASSVPRRLKYASVTPTQTITTSDDLITEPPQKRARTTASTDSKAYHHTLEEVRYATGWFDSMIGQ